jgi:ABC-type molybdate transport system permease subunit
MGNKVKIIIAVVLFVVAIGAIAYYLSSSRTEVSETMQELQNTPPGLPPDVTGAGGY